MTSPVQAVTTDDGRYYTWPRFPGRHFPSITTNIKNGVPKPIMGKWERKKIADLAVERASTLHDLKKIANA